ncbi:MAG TPA: hypothetical protein VIO94_01160 [Phenylobacterium sp.]
MPGGFFFPCLGQTASSTPSASQGATVSGDGALNLRELVCGALMLKHEIRRAHACSGR